MAYYKNANYLQHHNDAVFDQINHAGSAAPASGIYRCEACGHECGSTRGHLIN